HHRKEGWLRHQELVRSHQSRRRRGGFPFADRKTTLSSLSEEASRHFLDRSATPPCGDARRGIPASTLSNNPFSRGVPDSSRFPHLTFWTWQVGPIINAGGRQSCQRRTDRLTRGAPYTHGFIARISVDDRTRTASVMGFS